jgi:hypothetical protein
LLVYELAAANTALKVVRNYSGHSAFHHEDHKEITKCAKIAGFLPFFVIFAPSLRSLWLKAEQLRPAIYRGAVAMRRNSAR